MELEMPLKPAESGAGMTPMLRQYFELKALAAEAILFFRMGDFYEMFGDDALEVAPKLQIVLTSRERGDQTKIPFCGVPHHSARTYWLRLLRLGYKVAIADQMEDANATKGLVRRDITRILTPGSVDDLDALEAESPNYLIALTEDPETRRWVVVVAETSTGELRCGEVETLTAGASLILKHRPTEILVRRFFEAAVRETLGTVIGNGGINLTSLPEAILRAETDQNKILSEVLGSSDLGVQSCGTVAGGKALIASVFDYLRSLKAPICQFTRVTPLVPRERMVLDEIAIRDLELFESLRRREVKGSFFGEINHTLTPMGARLLRQELAAPLINAEEISRRHDAVAAFASADSVAFDELRSALQGMPDLERLFTRVVTFAVSPQELIKVLLAMRQIQAVQAKLSSYLNGSGGTLEKLEQVLQKCLPVREVLDLAINDAATLISDQLDFFLVGYDAELDRLRDLALHGQDSVDRYEAKLRADTGIGSLKIKEHKSFGMMIEVTKTHLAKVPKEFMRRQTMVNCERFMTFELQDLDASQKSAREQAGGRERSLFNDIVGRIAQMKAEVRAAARGLAYVDMLQSLAFKARRDVYVRPSIVENGPLIFEGSRHPVVERFVGRHDFTPNDIVMTPSKRHLLITGPNMAGKSTVMRQTALSVLLCQIGGYVPARKAQMPLFDRVFTRVGASDDLARGQSTFMVEMAEAANILRHATPKSLVLLDEVGRGTSTQDGLAIACAILEDLAHNVRCYTLFATHFHEIVPFAATLPGVRTLQTEVINSAEGIRFRHRLIDGFASSSFGLEVAQLAGLPERVIHRARALLIKDPVSGERRNVRASKLPPLERLGLEVIPHDRLEERAVKNILNALAEVNVNTTTPIQAINIISELRAQLDKSEWRERAAKNIN